MFNVSLIIEVFSLILCIVLLVHIHQKRWSYVEHFSKYLICLYMTMSSILLNIICVYIIDYANHFPYVLTMVLNSFYFFLINLTSIFMAYCAFCIILEHTYEKKYIKRIIGILGIQFIFYCIILILNVFYGFLFSFDSELNYVRGPLNQLGYFLLYFEVTLLLIFSYFRRKILDKTAQHLLKTLPVSVVLLSLYQLCFPEFYMNGSIMMSVNIILWLTLFSAHTEMDQTTKIGNRKSFIKELDLRIQDHQRFVVILVSIKRIKEVNTLYGLSTGDLFLYEIANYLDNVFDEGIAFRYRNIEIAVLVPYHDMDTVEKMLHVISQRFLKPWSVCDKTALISINLVYLIHDQLPYESNKVMEFLEYCMSCAKRKGEIVAFDHQIEAAIEKRHQLKDIMKDAIKEERFEVWLQPIYNIQEQKFTSAEALIRLKDHKGHIIYPNDFIPLAEESEIIDEISWYVLENICIYLQQHSNGIQTISVNVSSRQLESDDMIAKMEKLLKTYHIKEGQIKLEVTERILTRDDQKIWIITNKLKEMGVHCYLDDFGIGYSNVASIMTYPLECVKLDRTLIQSYPNNQQNKHLVEALIRLFHHLNLKIVVEGVETKEQYEALVDLPVDYIQGFYFSKPMPQDSIQTFLGNF